ncbi:glycoside hydrolase family 1 protein [Lentibacillus amyloliquefaciens]|uniref:6-phospho-beta-glucosidase n=1 Tax=Lentibacillus amyloliquefaciens TaxID=1472767 RepID=A0A0U4FWI9_9BACI|nr:glycoside hydrolase family 1 protein [Lentibacillus amyloliquefaciens]ALX50133.1 6-phospho-beta-glucosidase [Lentibacillus amyloliquefaciens]
MTLPYQFPKDFWWGSATSATQIEGGASEGGKGKNIWDHWYETESNRFFDNVGPETTSDFYHHYKEDIQRMAEIGHNTFRFSISWARLIPGGRGEVNQEAVTFYNNVIDELLANGIEPFVNLFHFDMPLELQEEGGWEKRAVVDAYAQYADECFRLFGDRVSKWFTFNEPIVPVEGGYLYDFHYPNIVDAKRAFQVAYNTMIGHAKAVDAFRKHDVKDGRIGIILNLTPSYPRSRNPADLRASRIADLFFNRSFLDPAVLGEYPQELIDLLEEHGHLPQTKKGDSDLLKANTAEILGVNYYQPRRVKAKENLPNPYGPFMPDWFFDMYEMPGRKMNPYRGWEIYEKGVYDIMMNLKENYGNIPSFISENGMGVQNEERFKENDEIQDDYRIEFIREHLKWLHKAIEEGANAKGYHLWSFMDNWSWMNAYKNRYGFFSVDLETKERTAKKSAHWIKSVAEKNGF